MITNVGKWPMMCPWCVSLSGMNNDGSIIGGEYLKQEWGETMVHQHDSKVR